MLIVLMLVIVCTLGLGYLSQQASRELDAELHNELNADKALVRSSLKWNARCSVAARKSCKLGNKLTMHTREGKVFIDETGNTRIGKWNVRVACDMDKRLGKVYHVQIARKGENEEFLDDPLTKHELSWTSLFPLKEFCESGLSKDDLVLRNDCYGNVNGRDRIISDLEPFCPRCAPNENFYCADDQIAFPACPSGYRLGMRYIDRFGWGGIDLTKISVCKKI